MARSRKTIAKKRSPSALASYENLFDDVAQVIEEARRAAARSVNAVMTATYWLVGRRIVEQEQEGKARADYGEALLERLSTDLSARFGRGFYLKLGSLTHADVGQMHLYLNYAREHWARPGENPPVGLILCAGKREAVARYALEGLPNKILASQYLTTLPQEDAIAAELEHIRHVIEERKGLPSKSPARGPGTRNPRIKR